MSEKGEKGNRNECENKKDFAINSLDQLLRLQEMYLREWMHRDELMWKQVFRLFYGILLFSIVPYLREKVDMNFLLELENGIHFLCILLSIIFLYVSFGYIARLSAASAGYRKLNCMLPVEFQEPNISIDPKLKKYNKKMSKIIIITLLNFPTIIAMKTIDFSSKKP